MDFREAVALLASSRNAKCNSKQAGALRLAITVASYFLTAHPAVTVVASLLQLAAQFEDLALPGGSQSKIEADSLKSSGGVITPKCDTKRESAPSVTELMELLTALGSDPANESTIVSGRPRQTLENWFGKLAISLIAEHGVWLRNKSSDWRIL
jgi:hypothetical protein